MIAVTLLAAWLSTRLRMSSDLSALFPDRGAAATLSQITRVFGGGDLALVLVEGSDPAEVAAATQAMADALREKPSVSAIVDHAPPRETDPTLAWAFAGPRARERLVHALEPDGMRERLAGSRELLLGPAASDAEEMLARDPLRLALIPWEERAELASGLSIGEDGAFVTNDGTARLLALQARGHAFESAQAHAFVNDVESAEHSVSSAHPSVTIGLAGGHAVAVATEAMIRGDMYFSASLSVVLVAIAFLVLFPRRRALLAILPPVALGGFWTAALGAFFPHGLSAVSVGFAAVVVGVGIDTGVHVYAAVEDGRREGMSPADAAASARKKTARPVLLAAVAAGACFAALVLSELTAMRELGVLCGAGEVLTSVAILGATPEIAAWLERKPPAPRKVPRWVGVVDRATATKKRAVIALVIAALPAIALAIFGVPKVGDAIIALRPKTLAPLAVQAHIYDRFGGKPGQYVVVTKDRDENAARVRADHVAEALDRLDIEGYDALSRIAPADDTVRERIAARDALDLPKRRADLERALEANGWKPSELRPALDAFEHPSPAHAIEPPPWALARWVGHDAGETLVLTYVRPRVEDGAIEDAVKRVDPTAVVTGWPLLERSLKDSLAHDLPRVALVALVLVAIALSASLRTFRDVALATITLIAALALVAAGMRLIGVRWHVYDALVVPVLLGITMDEAMFLLYAAKNGSARTALEVQGPLVACTALTTAAGFAALAFCRFEGLHDVGILGAIGSIAGLLASLFVVPAALRLR
jgi:predicted RND superfamily exporter protein